MPHVRSVVTFKNGLLVAQLINGQTFLSADEKTLEDLLLGQHYFTSIRTKCAQCFGGKK